MPVDISAPNWVIEPADLEGKGESPSFVFCLVLLSFYLFIFAFSLANKEEEKEEEEEEEEAISSGFFRVPPLLFPHSQVNEPNKGSRAFRHQQKVKDSAAGGSYGLTDNLLLMMELWIKIMKFRDILDLCPCIGSTPMNELLMGTVQDLQKLYPKFVSCPSTSEKISTSTYQGLHYFHEALKSVGDSWAETHNWYDEFNNEKDIEKDLSLEQLGKMVLERLGYMNTVAKEILDVKDEQEEETAHTAENLTDSGSEDFSKDSDFVNKVPICESPFTPTSVLPDTSRYSPKTGEFPNISYSLPLPFPLRIKAMGKLKPADVEHLSFHILPHTTIQNFRSVNQINYIPETENSEKISFVNELPLNIIITLESSMIQVGETTQVFNHISHDVTCEKDIDNANASTEPSLLSPNPPLSPMHLAKEFASLPQQQLQPMLSPTQSVSSPPPLLPEQSVPKGPPLPMCLQKRTSPPPPPPPPPQKQSAKTTPLLPPMLSPKEFATSPPPPPPSPPSVPSKNSKFPSPPPPLQEELAPPPPPLLVANKALCPEKTNTKLKRSTHMGSLYRLLKGKMEGANLSGNLSFARKVGGFADNKPQSMADALAEMTKRSAYFQKIEEDVQKHATSIMEMKSAINLFQTKHMSELRKFHQYVELHLEKLTDETQVLARFTDFPTKKLETIRIAAALFSRLDGIATNLESWKIEIPLAQQLEKVECYFNKIKVEVDEIERNKDREAKQFRHHNIEFNFHILLRIKEAMVDVSSNCIEMVLQESKKAKEDANREGGAKHEARLKACSQTLWKAFQLAYRVYNFAGGQDDRADKLTIELAEEIETFANQY